MKLVGGMPETSGDGAADLRRVYVASGLVRRNRLPFGKD